MECKDVIKIIEDFGFTIRIDDERLVKRVCMLKVKKIRYKH